MLAYGDGGPRFNCQRRLFSESLHTDFSTSVSVSLTLDFGLFISLLNLPFPVVVHLASITLISYLPSSSPRGLLYLPS